jgi:LemA protein
VTYLILIFCGTFTSWAILIYNRLVRDRNRVKTAWSDIDVQLKRRYDLIPKLVAAVEQYARYEQSTLKTIIEIRSQASQVDNADEKAPLEKLLGTGLGKLIALAEDYPELKADQSFLQLQRDLTDVENHIQYARRYYNGAVRNLNTRIASFPDLLIARSFGFQPQGFFELESTVESDSPEISAP